MDIFKFTNPTAPTKMERGVIINGLKSKLWVERYRQAGEFKLVGPVRLGLQQLLPIGAFVSHVDTSEVMIVEDHEINEDRDKESMISISGRGFEAFFENRVVGSNKTLPFNTGVTDYTLTAGYLWIQARDLIQNHVLASLLIDDDNEIPYLQVIAQAATSGTSIQRSVQQGELYSRLMELLEIEDLGIRVFRPGPLNPAGSSSVDMSVVIHKGIDRSASLVFSYDSGEVESADYLWSSRLLKNCALVSGKWIQVLVDHAAVGMARRMLFVDANDIDNTYSVAPTGGDLTNVQNAMQQRGILALAGQKSVDITKIDVSKKAGRAVYRRDYQVGDTIMVDGDYNATSKRVVSEYVEIEDENGASGYPTLAPI